MKYDIGDEVIIRKDLVVGDRYGGVTCFEWMKKEIEQKGNIAIIADAGVDSKGVIRYDFKGFGYSYSEQMIEGLVEKESTSKKGSNNMKYKVGDKVKIRKDLVVGDYYNEWLFTEEMEKDVKSNDYILTISKAYIAYDEKTPVYQYEECTTRADDSRWELTESMIEGVVVESTDREKFEECMRKLSSLSLNSHDNVWEAFNNLTYLSVNDSSYDETLKVVSDYLFGPKKKMTKAEIEAKLGYEIEIVEE